MTKRDNYLDTQSEKLFRLAFETNPDPIAISRVSDGTYVDGNSGLFKVLGYKKEEVLGKSASELGIWVDPKDRERFVKSLQGTGMCDDLLARFRRKDGGVVWGLLSARTFELDGELYNLSVTRDITKRVRMENEQRALADSTTAVLQNENIDLALASVLKQAREVLEANAAYITRSSEDSDGPILFEDSRGEVISADPTARSRLLELMSETRKNRKPVFENHLSRELNGVFNAVFVPLLLGPDVRGIMALANKQDGFDEHDVELAAAFGQICALALERHDLQYKMAQSDRLASMGMLAAGVAHEINNPLSFVMYHLETLEQDLSALAKQLLRQKDGVGSEGEEAKGGNKAISESLEILSTRAHEASVGAERIKEISASLGTFSRVEYRESSLVDLVAAIEHAVTMAYNQIKYRARIVKEFVKMPPVMASEGHLAQVVLNLLVNAAHAIEEGDVDNNEIRIRTWTENGSNFFEVSDTGNGISQDKLERIFEPFFTTKPVGVGSGLGLSICKNIVSKYGGDISVSSKLGKGTSFVVRLPAWNGNSAAIENSSFKESPNETPHGRILVVDDEQQVRSVVEKILSKQHEVLTASSGTNALELLEKDTEFDAILCDMMMPDVSGMDLHEWLCANHPQLAKKFVFITGGAFTPKVREYLARVDSRRLDKPFSVKKLRNFISELLKA